MVKALRDPAVIVSCKEFLEANYIEGAGWTPGFLEIDGKEVRRVNIIGILVYSGDNFIVIDDGSGSIYVNTLNAQKIELPEIGNSVLVIGRPRRYNEYNYISAEIVAKVRSEWLNARKSRGEANIKKEKGKIEGIPEGIVNNIEKEIIIKKIIKEKDREEGIEINDIILEAKKRSIEEETCRKIIENLMKTGEIYEIKKGRIRPL